MEEQSPLLVWQTAAGKAILRTIGAGVRVQIAGRRSLPDQIDRYEDAAGGGLHATCRFSQSQLSLRLRAAWSEGRLELSGVLRNEGASPLRIEQLWLGECTIELGGLAADYRVYYNSGCQESSGTRRFSRITQAARSVQAYTDPDDPDAWDGKPRQHLFASTCVQPDHIRSQYVTVIYRKERPAALCIGCASFHRAEMAIFVKPGPSDMAVIVSPVIYYNRLRLDAGQELATEGIVAFVDDNPLLALEHYADHVRDRKALKLKPLDSITGLWNYWVAFTEEQNDSGAETRAMEYQHTKLLGYNICSCPVGVVWHRDNAFFESRCKLQLGSSVAEAAARLAVRFPKLQICDGLFWGAASECSDFFQQHSEAMLHDTQGRLCPRGSESEPSWGRCSSPSYWVDFSHPATRQFFGAHLLAMKEKVDINTFNFDFMGDHGEWKGAWGYLREDDNPFLNCEPHDSALNRPFETGRVLPQMVRQIIGPSVVIRTYTTMFMRLLGLADVVRTAADALRVEYGGRLLPVNWDHLRGILQNLAANYVFHGRWWWSDSCAICVGTQPVPQRREEFRIRSMMSFIVGGPITLGDDIPRMAPEQFRYYTINIPSTGHAAKPLDLFERELPQVYHLSRKQTGFGHDLLSLINLTDAAREYELRLSNLGLEGAYLAFEFWTKEIRRIDDGVLKVTLLPKTARHYALHRSENTPFVLGTDFHLSMGAIEISSFRWNQETKTLSGSIRRPDVEMGRLYIYVPRHLKPKGEQMCDASRVTELEVPASSVPVPWQVSFEDEI